MNEMTRIAAQPAYSEAVQTFLARQTTCQGTRVLFPHRARLVIRMVCHVRRNLPRGNPFH